MRNHLLINETNHIPSQSAAPVGIRRSTMGALRLKTGLKAGLSSYPSYLGNNPGNQGRNHSDGV